MSTALQMPLEVGEAKNVGGRLFRKQVLSLGEINYKDRRLRFDRPLLETLVKSFDKQAFDQVPLVLANDENLHNESPERFRGEVKALELTQDGLDAIVELTEDGAELVRKNPRLGVSARIVQDLEQADGRRFPHAIRHVCATLDPKLTGMRPWESVSLSVRWAPQDEDQVIDLSQSHYVSETQTPTLSDQQLDELKGLSGDERAAKARELLGEMTTGSSTAPEGKERKFSLKGLLGIKDDKISDDELEAAIAKLESDEEDEPAEEREPVGASLSADDRKTIDLANDRAAKAEAKVAKAEWKTDRKEYADAGVPPAMLDLCAPLFEDGRDNIVDLSNGAKLDVKETVRKLLDEAKGIVDLSGERGSTEETDEDKEAKAKAKDDKAWGVA